MPTNKAAKHCPLIYSPEFPLAFREWRERLSDAQRLLLDLASLGAKEKTMALRMQCSTRTIRRIVKSIRASFHAEFF